MIYLTIITATFNRYEYLKKNYQNKLFLYKNFKKIEWIILAEKKDNNKNKNFYKRLNKKKFINVKIGNFGNVEKAFHEGLRLSRGKYIIFHGDDDFFDIKNIKLLNENLFEKDYEWIIFNGSYIDENFNLIRKNIANIKKILLHKNFLIKIHYINYIMTPSIFVRKKILKKYGNLPKNKTTGSDFITWINLSKYFQPKIFNKNISYAMFTKSTISGTFNFKSELYLIYKMVIRNRFDILGFFSILILGIYKIIHSFFVKNLKT